MKTLISLSFRSAIAVLGLSLSACSVNLSPPTLGGGGAAFTKWDEDAAVVAELTALNTKLTQAYEKEDIATLKGLLSEQHVHNNVFGSRLSKKAFLEDIESGTLEFVSYETPDLEWYVRGDMAVATGVIEAKAVRGGKPVPASKFVFTRIFVKEGGEWKVLLFHNTMVGKPPVAG